MIRYVHGDLFSATVDALVNPVNCEGVMGKGIAKEFKKRYPMCFQVYKDACENEQLFPGKLLLVKCEAQKDLFSDADLIVIHFPTKKHWRGKSRLEWIEAGLEYLKYHYKEWGIRSVAMPKLGAGLGGLEWNEVKLLIERILSDEKLIVEVYE